MAAQEHLEMGNQALLEEDLDAAKRAYGESIRIKDSAIGTYHFDLAFLLNGDGRELIHDPLSLLSH